MDGKIGVMLNIRGGSGPFTHSTVAAQYLWTRGGIRPAILAFHDGFRGPERGSSMSVCRGLSDALGNSVSSSDGGSSW